MIYNCLVTGGAGFIGSHLVEHLLESGLRVRVLDNFRNGKYENLPQNHPSLQIVHGDITDRDTCLRACQGIDEVYHLACLGVRHSIHNPVENHQVNALGTLYMLEGARQQDVKRFLYMSTSEIYGKAIDFPITEATTPWPLTVYGSSKLAGEHYTRSYQECYGLNTICVRTFNNFGPRAHYEGDAGEVIPRMIIRALTGLPLIVFGDGSITRDFYYVGDCVQMLPRILNELSLSGKVINLGYGEEISIQTLANTILEMLKMKHLGIDYAPPRPADVPRLWVDTTLLKQSLDYRPLTTFSVGIKKTVDYYTELHRKNPDAVLCIKEKNWEA